MPSFRIQLVFAAAGFAPIKLPILNHIADYIFAGCLGLWGSFRPVGYKTFSMLNSAENEILPGNKQQITNKYSGFLAQFSRV